MPLEFDLVIPLFNEAGNVPTVVGSLVASQLDRRGLRHVYLIDNGSTDGTGPLLDELASRHSYLKAVHLPTNLNYGGGVLSGLKLTTAPVVGYLPGDDQVSFDDVARAWDVFRRHPAAETGRLIVKGHRTVRHDPRTTRLASRVYTGIVNALLGLKVRDVNGLPKLFHRELLDSLPLDALQTFVFDAQLLAIARRLAYEIEEIAVTFHARRAGISSWSGKRWSVYLKTITQLATLRIQMMRRTFPIAEPTRRSATIESPSPTETGSGGRRK